MKDRTMLSSVMQQMLCYTTNYKCGYMITSKIESSKVINQDFNVDIFLFGCRKGKVLLNSSYKVSK